MAREFAIAFTATQTVNYSIRWAARECPLLNWLGVNNVALKLSGPRAFSVPMSSL
ncbi:hypothetical protein RSAG8_03979, partial [Rhizoctonia solani AG-8 WAC10335]